jgi:hypothetical protein
MPSTGKAGGGKLRSSILSFRDDAMPFQLQLTRQINTRRITPPEFADKEEMMGAKSQNVFAAAILVVAVMHCWSAEAAPKNPGYKQIVRNASPDITTRIGTQDSSTATCYVYNKSDENICVVYDVYPVWNFSQPSHGTVSQFIPGKNGRSIAWAFSSQQASMQCRLVSARYMPWNDLCR